jgi:general stress protein 26
VSRQLYERLREFATATIVTHDRDGTMTARRMTIARIDPTGRLYFVVPISDEEGWDPDVTVVFRRGSHRALVRGAAHIRNDPALVHSVWREAWRAHFPAGPDDPRLAIVIVDPYAEDGAATAMR